jgi:membrane-associated progesterone receptor component
MASRHALLYFGVLGMVFGVFILPLLEVAFPGCPWLRIPGSTPESTARPRADVSSTRVWTLDELREYDGRDSQKPLMLSIGGFVMDVSSGAKFYSPGTEYAQFAGRAATRALSIASLDMADISDDVADFTDRQRGEMEERIQFYLDKYTTVGTLANTHFDTHSKDSSVDEAAPAGLKPLYDADQLARYDGSCSEDGLCRSIFVSVSGDVFNVTKLLAIYGPGRPRSMMAGRAITRTLVRLHTLKDQGGAAGVLQEDVSDDCTQFTQHEKDVAAEQLQYFHANFPHVGGLIGWS